MSVRIRSAGHGPDIALLHGWGLGANVWSSVATGLETTCRVHRVSLAGYDGTAPDDLDFSATAVQVAAALPAGCTLCGWSLGGMLALEAARLRPQQVGRLVLVATSPRFIVADDWPHGQAPALLESFRTVLAGNAKATLSRFVMLFNQGDSKARAISRVLAPLIAQNLPDTPTLLRGLEWLADVDQRAHVPAIVQPALVIHGDSDPLMPAAAGHYLAGMLPNAGLERWACYAETAHAPFLAAPEEFIRSVSAFCQRSHDAP